MESKIININKDKLPSHIAIIMDGNGRWAKQQGKNRIFGHKQGVETVRKIVEASAEIGLKYLTLYTFSVENWQRPKNEINALMSLLVNTIKKEIATLMKNNIRLEVIGDMKRLPDKTYNQVVQAMKETANNTGLTLIMALSYSSRWDILNAVSKISELIKNNNLSSDQINEKVFSFVSESFHQKHPYFHQFQFGQF